MLKFLKIDIVDLSRLRRRPRACTQDECEEKAARRDVTKWASYSREFRHGLRVGVNKGTTGMPAGLFSIRLRFTDKKRERVCLLL